TKRSVDYAGAGLFFVAISALMIMFIESGEGWDWISVPAFFLFFLFLSAILSFIWWQTKPKSPMMPLHLWKNRLIAFANLATLTSGAMMIGLSTFLPTYVQGVMGETAVVAGFTLTMMSVAWPLASTFAGYIFLKIGYRMTALLGSICLFIGALFFITIDVSKGSVWAGTGSFVFWLGMGLDSTTFYVSVIYCIVWDI